MATKKRDFSLVAEKALRRPTNMSDFLDNGKKNSTEADEKKGRAVNALKNQPSNVEKRSESNVKPDNDKKIEDEKSSGLREQTTLYMDLHVSDILDDLWIQLRRKAPKGGKKRISKSLIINKMIEYFDEEIKKEGFSESKLVQMILLK